MRHSHTDPEQTTLKDGSDGWNSDLDGRRLRSDADAVDPADEIAQRDRIRRAGSEPGSEVEMTGGAWQDIKSRFVDDPRGAIAAAEQLVQQALESRVRALQDEATAVCARDRDVDDASSTEALRTRLIRYQQYCERLGNSAIH